MRRMSVMLTDYLAANKVLRAKEAVVQSIVSHIVHIEQERQFTVFILVCRVGKSELGKAISRSAIK